MAPAPSREARKSRFVRRLRWLVLAAMIGTVALVLGLYLFGRAGQGERTARVAAPEPDDLEPSGEMLTVGEGFERVFTEGDRPVLEVRGASYQVNRDDIAFLQEVEIVLHRPDGSRFDVTGERARFDLETRDAALSGTVRVLGPRGTVIEAPRVDLSGRGQTLSSSGGEVRLVRSGRFEGRANQLRSNLSSKLYILDGDVRIDSLPEVEVPFGLDAKRLYIEEDRPMVRAEGNVVLERGDDILVAKHLAAHFTEDERVLRFVRARWQVAAILGSRTTGAALGAAAATLPGDDGSRQPTADAGRASRLEIETTNLSLLLTEDGTAPEQIELEGGPRGAAILRSFPVEGPAERFVARLIQGSFVDGVPARLDASDGVLIESGLDLEPAERPEEMLFTDSGADQAEPLRRARGAVAMARFGPEGDVSRLELRGREVELVEAGSRAVGREAIFDAEADRLQLTGAPALLVDPRGEFRAPRIDFDRAEGIVHGVQGTQALLEQGEGGGLGALEGSPLGRGDEPIRVESTEGYLRDTPRAFLFTGAVRAWRDDTLITAESLYGDEAEDRLTAEGGVRTLWRPGGEEGATPVAASEGSDGGASDLDGGPVDVRSRTMEYRRGERVLVYEGAVKAVRDGRTMSCRTLTVTLDEEGEAETLRCTGQARIEDPTRGYLLTGADALYDLDRRTVLVEAAPAEQVLMKHADGREIRGPRMLYDLDADRVQVLGRDDATTPPSAPAAGAATPTTESP